MLLFGLVLGFALATTFIDLTLWVRGAAGKAREYVLGAAPAPAAQVSSARPNNPIRLGDLVSGAGNVLAFVARNPVLIAGALILFAFLWAGATCRGPFGLGPSRDTLRAELKEARVNTAVLEHERDLERKAGELGIRTTNTINAARAAAAQGQQDIANAVASLPPSPTAEHFADLQRRYCAAYERVSGIPSCAGGANPAPAGPDGVHRPTGDAA